MFKPTSNPRIEALTKSCRQRSLLLSRLNPHKDDLGRRWCTWCGVVEIKKSNQKYCSSACSLAIFAWANPQIGNGLHYLLSRQDWQCRLCNYSYMEVLRATMTYCNQRNYLIPQVGKDDSRRFMRWFKDFCPEERKPEVDHVVPIHKGGQAIGFDNHQAICAFCHKRKTKVDLSGPKKKKETKDATVHVPVPDAPGVPGEPGKPRQDDELS